MSVSTALRPEDQNYTASANKDVLTVTAPAKLNLFLHVTGRRPDGYHTIQTAFQPISYHDTLHLARREDSVLTLRCVRNCPIALIDEETFVALDSAQNLVLRAARALRAHDGPPYGADITLYKRIPVGGGLGGGSSDAAATLLALNRMWGLNKPVDELVPIGLSIGVDVPVMLHGRAAWGENIGDQLEFIDPPQRWYLILYPAVSVLTGPIFSDPSLKRDTTPITLDEYLSGAVDTRNDLQLVVEALHPAVAEASAWLGRFSPARMSGSGSSVFCSFEREEDATAALAQVPEKWGAFVAQAMNRWDHFAQNVDTIASLNM